ncbi:MULTISPECIES: TetR/AcrR family transcriptional regulator [unclassified Streptomyces]|uniref:TetR/AcrR family transcriptional regulator n=1 Tax=unclassified Streptomyces TaxID=2593676 RepID=UPI0036B2162A
MATNAKERLLGAAERLFYEEGIRAVGIERILSESGVGRASFYRHFPSKDDVVVEVLRRRDGMWRAWLDGRIAVSERAPEELPLALFDGLAERFAAASFRGCAFINTMVETADPDSPAHHVAAEHKEKVIAVLDRLLTEGGYREHESLARQLALLGDGAIVTALREGTSEAAVRARGVAEILLRTAERETERV